MRVEKEFGLSLKFLSIEMAFPVLLGAIAIYTVVNWPRISSKLIRAMAAIAGAHEENFPKNSRMPASSVHSGFLQAMTEKEALDILGIRSQAATVGEIRKSYRDLIARNHLDAGGSEYITYKINEARDLLLKNRRE